MKIDVQIKLKTKRSEGKRNNGNAHSAHESKRGWRITIISLREQEIRTTASSTRARARSQLKLKTARRNCKQIYRKYSILMATVSQIVDFSVCWR